MHRVAVEAYCDYDPTRGLQLLRQSRRARQVLLYLMEAGRAPTKKLLQEALGRVSKKDHELLLEMEKHGLVARYAARVNGRRVVYVEPTTCGKILLLIATL